MHATPLSSSYGRRTLCLVFALCFASIGRGQDTDRTNVSDKLREALVSARQLAKDVQRQISDEQLDLRVEDLATIEKEIEGVDRRIYKLATTIRHVNLALATGRSKVQLLASIERGLTSKFSSRRSDTQRMLNPHEVPVDETKSEANLDVDSQFNVAMHELAESLAEENLRRLQLLEQKQQFHESHSKPTNRLSSLLKELDGLSQRTIDTLERIRVPAPNLTEPNVAR